MRHSRLVRFLIRLFGRQKTRAVQWHGTVHIEPVFK